MTSQVALLNSVGVALASDSVVSFGSKGRTYSTVNKVFSLAENFPVAIMISGAANFIPANLPWERIIGEFSKKQIKEKTTLSDYFYDFMRHCDEIANMNGDSNHKAIQSDLVEYFTERVVTAASARERTTDAFYGIEDYVPEVKDWFSEAINERVEEIHKNAVIGLKEFKENESNIPWYLQVKECNTENVERAATFFCKRHDCAELEKKVQDIFLYHLVVYGRESYWKRRSTIVITGFGEADDRPAMISFDACCNVGASTFDNFEYQYIRPQTVDDGGELRELESFQIFPKDANNPGNATQFSGSAIIKTFAYDKEMLCILEGIHYELGGPLSYYFPPRLSELISEKIKHELENTQGIGKVTVARFLESRKEKNTEIKELIRKELDAALQNGMRYRREIFRSSVSSLPMSELSSFAKILVSLESEIMHYSKDANVVGGPIDVAKITKEEGFSWVELGNK